MSSLGRDDVFVLPGRLLRQHEIAMLPASARRHVGLIIGGGILVNPQLRPEDVPRIPLRAIGCGCMPHGRNNNKSQVYTLVAEVAADGEVEDFYEATEEEKGKGCRSTRLPAHVKGIKDQPPLVEGHQFAAICALWWRIDANVQVGLDLAILIAYGLVGRVGWARFPHYLATQRSATDCAGRSTVCL